MNIFHPGARDFDLKHLKMHKIKWEHPPLGLSRAGGREALTQEEVQLAGPDRGVPLSGESPGGHTPLRIDLQ